MTIALERKQAASALTVSLRTLDELVRTGEIRVCRVGRRVIVPVSALEEFLNGSQRQLATTAR